MECCVFDVYVFCSARVVCGIKLLECCLQHGAMTVLSVNGMEWLLCDMD